MSEVEIELEDGVLQETQKIAAQMGLTIDEILTILLRKFNSEKGFFFPINLQELKGYTN